MTHRYNTLRAALVTTLLAASAGAASAAGTASCDPLYPCYADEVTPATVYDLTVRKQDQNAPTAEGLESDLTLHLVVSRVTTSPAAVYDLEARTEHSPCQSYPCYPEQTKLASPVAADADVTLRKADERG
jgi:hypothetical protein